MQSVRRPLPAPAVAGRVPGAGVIVRSARTSQGLTLAELGKRVGCSAAQVSRYERGIAPLTDIAVLRRFAAASDPAAGLRPGTGAIDPAAATRRPVPGDSRTITYALLYRGC